MCVVCKNKNFYGLGNGIRFFNPNLSIHFAVTYVPHLCASLYY